MKKKILLNALVDAITKIRIKKVPEIDEIQPEMIKHMGEKSVELLTELTYNTIKLKKS